MRARIEIRLRPGVLDPEAVAIGKALGNLGFHGIGGVRRAKIIELDLATRERSAAERQLREMCERLLANPVIETYEIHLLD